MPYYFLSSILVRSRQAARLFLLRFLRTCHRLILVQAAEDPSYPTRLKSSTLASVLVEQQLQTNFVILSEHLSQIETQHRYHFFLPVAILFLTLIWGIITTNIFLIKSLIFALSIPKTRDIHYQRRVIRSYYATSTMWELHIKAVVTFISP